MAARFAYELDVRLAAMWAPLLLAPGHRGDTLTDDGRFVARIGLLRVDTPLANIEDAHVTGPYRWWTAADPLLSFRDDGLTFGPRNQSVLTVTVADPEGLARALTA
jgi:hypothetical protein